MELKEIFGIDPEELRDVMSRLETACICLGDMGRNVTRGRFVRRKDRLCYFAGYAFPEEKDVLGNVWKERVPLYICADGFVVGDGFFSDIRFEVELDFDREKFIRDSEAFMEVCEEEARRIDGDRGISYLMYGLYCLRNLKKFTKERFLSWDRFRQLV